MAKKLSRVRKRQKLGMRFLAQVSGLRVTSFTNHRALGGGGQVGRVEGKYMLTLVT